MRHFCTVLLFILSLLYSVKGYGQTSKFYTSEQLSSSMISSACIAQDAEGYIWVGTENGLNRYDGYHFVSFLNNENDSTSLGFNLVSTLLCESSGQVWVGTAKGLDLYDSHTNSFFHFKFPDGLHPRVSKIIRLKNGKLLAGTAGYGLYWVDELRKVMKRIQNFTHQDDDEFYSSLFEDSKGNLWKCDAIDKVTFNRYDSRAVSHSFVTTSGTPMAFVERNDEVLILCLHGMMVYRNGHLEPYPIIMDAPGIQDIVFRSMYMDNKGNLYLGTRGHGLFCMAPNSNVVKRVEASNPNIDLNSSKVWAVYIDKQDNLWIGCQQKGLLMIPGEPSCFDSWSFSEQNYSLGTPVTAICKGDNGIIWCSVQGNGIYGFDSNGRIVAHPAAPPAVEFIYRDTKSTYWVGSDDGLYQYNPNTGRYQLISQFDCDKFNDLTDDGNGNIFISTFSRGFCRYNTQTHQWKNYNSTMTNASKGELCNNWIHALMPDREGLLWIATATGVSCFDADAENFKPLGWTKLLDGVMCYSLCEQANGDILIGTDMGLYLYQRLQDKISKFPHSQVLDNKVVSYIVSDQAGNIWCSTSMGIWQYQQQQQKWIGYIKGNGLNGREYVVGAGLHTANNTIYFGTADGITSFNPQNLNAIQTKIGDIHLTSFQMDGQYYSTQNVNSFIIPYQTNSFTLEFSLLDYMESENTTFEYRFQNHSEWISLNVGENGVSFNHLASGTYNLEVRATVGGAYSPVSCYEFVVTTPWFKSGWAYFLYAILTTGIILFLVYIYVRDKRRQLDEEKTKFLINATHDIRSPLTLIMSPLNKLKQRHTSPEDMEELGLIEHNTQRILGLVNQILDLRKIDKKQMQLHFQKTNLTEFVNGIFKMYSYNATERNITYTYHHPDQPVVAWIDHTQFDKVVSNLISNAFKYTFDGGYIEVELEVTDNQKILLKVTDDGIVIKEEDRLHIFERFYQSRQSDALHLAGTGIGLNLCKMIVEMHYGSIEALQGNGGEGSTFVVQIPMGKAHLHPEELKDTQSVKSQDHCSNTHYHILFVDDDIELCNYIMKELGHYYHIHCCYNGREAIRVLLNRPYDLVVSDIMMPEMDGFNLLRLIKKNPELNHIPVILLTSKSDIGNRLEGLEKGADAFMAKPFSMQELHVLINSLISNVLRLKGKFSGVQQPSETLNTKTIKGNDEILMERVMKAISHHLDDSDFGVIQLSKEVGLSKTHLQRKLKDLTGLSIAEFIRNVRLEQAARLLKEQKINISQVAYTVGFSNLSHFSTVFKKHFGFTPTEYIANVQQDT